MAENEIPAENEISPFDLISVTGKVPRWIDGAIAPGGVLCVVDLPGIGRVDYAATPDDDAPLGVLIWEAVKDAEADFAFETAEVYLDMTNRAIDGRHSEFLEFATGGASAEERDTWGVTEAAARAVVADTATDAQRMLLTAEAAERGATVEVLAATIIGKADDYLMAVAQAKAFRAHWRKVAAEAAALPTIQDAFCAGAACVDAMNQAANEMVAQTQTLTKGGS